MLPKHRTGIPGPSRQFASFDGHFDSCQGDLFIDAITQPWPLGPADDMRISLAVFSGKRRPMDPNIPLLLASKQLPVCILLYSQTRVIPQTVTYSP